MASSAQRAFSPFVETASNGLNRLTLMVDGIHCAGCIRKIESTLAAEQDVERARLNFSTRRLTLEWHGTPERADHLAHRVENLGYGVHPYDAVLLQKDSDEEGRFLLLSLGVAGFAAGNIMLLSFALWMTSAETMGPAMRDFLHWIGALIAIPAVAFAGRPFFRSAWGVLSKGHTNMDVPISVALILTTGMSLFELINRGEHAYFDSVVMLMFFLLIGRTLDHRARRSARSAAMDIVGMMGGTATILEEGKSRVIHVRDISENMLLMVAPGTKIPADGVIISGHSSIDESLVTGETLPRSVVSGDSVHAGTINLSSSLTMRSSRATDDTLVAEIVRLMEQAEKGQARYIRLADRIARHYTPVVHILALAAFVGWWLFMGIAWQKALLIGATVLIITCPCALGLAVPVVQVLATSMLMKRRILVKSGDALERLAAIDTVIFDKTGTLTRGRPALENPQDIKNEDLQLAASLAAHSHHPLSEAVARSYGGALIDCAVAEHQGQGLEAKIDGKTIRLGSRSWCGDKNAPVTSSSLELWLAIEGRSPLSLHFSDALRPDAKQTIDALKKAGFNIMLLSGDRPAIVERTAQELGIENWKAAQTPVEKFACLEALRREGRKILMVGDGLNDAPVLAGADVSMSPSSAIDLAQTTADIVFMGDSLAAVTTVWNDARLSQKLIRQNIGLSIFYNAFAVPLAMAGMVTPLIAALAMSGSSLVVILNAFRLKWRRP